MDSLSLLRLLSASVTALMGLVVAFALVYGRVSALSRLRQFSAPPRPLTEPELDGLQQWQRRTLRWFVVSMGAVSLWAVASLLTRWLTPSAYLAMYVALLGIAVAGLTIHFSGHCPVCSRRIGFQSALLLPPACEICGAVFRPNVPLAPLLRSSLGRGVRVVSNTKILGWPLFAVAFGPDPETGGASGVARAVVAVGDVAIGFVAVGGFAAGVLFVGGVSVGLLSVGGVAVGVAAVGGLAAGGLALGGLAVGVYAMGGLAVGLHAWGGLALGSGAAAARGLASGLTDAPPAGAPCARVAVLLLTWICIVIGVAAR